MDEPILTLLTWCFLLLVYIFFFRVLQAVWKGSTTRVSVQQVTGRSESQPAASSKRYQTPVGRPSASGRPKVVKILEPTSLAGRECLLEDEVTIGRSADCTITLEDAYISQQHARVSVSSRGVVVEDLGSTNGTFLNNEKVRGSKQAHLGDRIRVGTVLLELR